MEKYLPIICVRGYAGSQGAVESTVDRPYYGFNLGCLLRAKWAGLDSDLPAADKRYPRNDNIRFPLPSKKRNKWRTALIQPTQKTAGFGGSL
jgi:hypothetical protein